MSTAYKYFLLVIIAAVLFLPMAQHKFDLFETTILEGDITIAQKTEFNSDNYWSLKWQDDFTKYINDNFGFRSWFVRLNNQIRFSVFNCTKAPGVVIGKNGELFIESYIDDYIGRNFIGRSKIGETVSKIKALQDSLKSLNTDLIVVFAPGKASYYPELIPDTYIRKMKDSTNYNVYANEFLKNKINFIDFNKWFFNNKTKFKHPVYPKFGTHWNHYGMNLAMDSLIKYIEKKRNINIPDYDFSLLNYSPVLKGNDYDIGILTNLLFPLDKDANPYPVYKFKGGQNYTRPNVLVVGDSYWYCLVGENLPIKFFSIDEYWFYNRDLVVNNGKKDNAVKNLNLFNSLAQRDAIILLATEATFYMFPYGFADEAYKAVNKKIKDGVRRKAYLPALVERIKNTKEWMADIEKKAKEKNIGINEMILLDANYIFETEYCKPEYVAAIDEIKVRMWNTPEWIAQMRQKAKEKNISFQEMIELDAKYDYETHPQ